MSSKARRLTAVIILLAVFGVFLGDLVRLQIVNGSTIAHGLPELAERGIAASQPRLVVIQQRQNSCNTAYDQEQRPKL